MKSVALQISEIQSELQERLNWITLAQSLLEYAARHVNDETIAAEMRKHAEKAYRGE